MKLIISSVSGEPIYEQIKTQIHSAVLSGELKAGEALPSLRKLAKELRISQIRESLAEASRGAKAAGIPLNALDRMLEEEYRKE